MKKNIDYYPDFGGNQDDAYYRGISDGEIRCARNLSEKLGIKFTVDEEE